MKLRYILILILVIVLPSGCDDDFMERYPLDQISDQNFWKSESDLKLYANSFYGTYIEGFDNSLGVRQPWGYKGSRIPYADLHSDNAVPEDQSIVRMVNGSYILPTSAGSGGWNWANVRGLNYFLANYHRADIAENIRNIYVGEIMFFKTLEYFEKVKLFGEVPWYHTPLQTNSEELYAPRTPRAELMDSVLMTIDKAIAYLPEKGLEADGRINKDMALLVKARVCLFEGTFRTYHTDLGLDPEKFLQEAVDASEELMTSGTYALWSTGDPENDYHDLFIQNDYANNPEIILYKKYSPGLLGHGFLRYFLWNQGENVVGLSKSLVEEYLCIDGLPPSISPEFLGDGSILTELAQRDPRLTQTVSYPGEYALNPDITGSFLARGKGFNGKMPGIRGTGEEFPSPTGYWPIKFWKNDPAEANAFQTGTMPCPVFRYAEALLINAEAHAELGTCTQAVLDATINKLRARAGMPDLQLADVPADPEMDGKYSTYVGYVPTPLIREIRRERRVELAWEGARWDDLVRWKAGGLLTVPEAILGIKFNQDEYPGVDAGSDVYLSDDGYLAPYKNSLPGGRSFEEPKQYYFPIPTEERVMNPNLAQSRGWDTN